ncbi:8526_t:CDS:1, partial [Dentiscutata erythropus]
PKHQQAAIQKKLNNIINTPLIILQNPQVTHTRGRPLGVYNYQTNNSTRRDLSGYKLVEHK